MLYRSDNEEANRINRQQEVFVMSRVSNCWHSRMSHPFDIYDVSPKGGYRYSLGMNVPNPIIIIGLNPSYATPENLDKTLYTVEEDVIALKKQGYIMLNVCPFRTPYPNKLPKTMNYMSHNKNLSVIKYIISKYARRAEKNNKSLYIWAAWGEGIKRRAYLMKSILAICKFSQKYNNIIWLKKDTDAEHPHHPLYLKKGIKLIEFDFESYCNNI